MRQNLCNFLANDSVLSSNELPSSLSFSSVKLHPFGFLTSFFVWLLWLSDTFCLSTGMCDYVISSLSLASLSLPSVSLAGWHFPLLLTLVALPEDPPYSQFLACLLPSLSDTQSNSDSSYSESLLASLLFVYCPKDLFLSPVSS